jgi:hypothetical protein
MKTILRSDIPSDFSYYRTGSRVFYEYYKKYTQLVIHRVWSGHEFIKAWKIVGKIYSIIAEKLDVEPTKEMLEKLDIHHGVIFWWPMRIIEKPLWWFRIPTIISKFLFHSSRSSFSVLDREDFWNKWSPKARAHRRKIVQWKESGKLRVESISDPREYLNVYVKTKVPDPYKEYLLQWCKKKFAIGNEGTRIYMAYIDNQPLAGAIFIDEWVTSEYFTSFYSRESHPYHLGVAIMDTWFADSYKMGIKYCDLDHMRDKGQSFGFAGYTKFKESIVDYDVYFHDMWIKFF